MIFLGDKMIIEYADGQKFALTFDKKKHGYYMLEDTHGTSHEVGQQELASGESGHKKVPIQSVTRVIDTCFPKNLHEWSVREGANKFKEVLSERGFVRNEKAEVDEVYEQIIGAYKDVSSHAAEIGDIVHNLISKRLSWTDPLGMGDLEDNAYGDEVSVCMSAFLDWARSRKVKFLRSEKIVYHHSHNPIYRFVGTLDAVVKIDGKLFVVDFKTSKKIYKHYHLQVAAYAAAYQKETSFIKDGGIDYPSVDGMILRLDKRTGKYQEKIFSLQHGKHFKIFKNCLEIKAWNSKRITGVKHVD